MWQIEQNNTDSVYWAKVNEIRKNATRRIGMPNMASAMRLLLTPCFEVTLGSMIQYHRRTAEPASLAEAVRD